MKDRLKTLLLGLVALAVLGALAVVAGIVPVTASSGHWPPTEWFLRFAMRRSVATHSSTITPPTGLAERGRILHGAGHYAIGCASCHGAPGKWVPSIPAAMTPSPPALGSAIRELDDAELFYILKHGIKFSGMPAWPAPGRDDEIWSTVAFLRQLPGMSGERYNELTGGAISPDPLTGQCARCHGRKNGGFPVLDGQKQDYLRASLTAYARSQRHSGTMGAVASSLDAQTIRALAEHYAHLPRPSPPAASDRAAIRRGASIARDGVGDRIPACAECHGPGGTPRKPSYPDLAGQPARYLVRQLELFASGKRGGSENAHLMDPVASRLDTGQMRDVAQFYESVGTGENND